MIFTARCVELSWSQISLALPHGHAHFFLRLGSIQTTIMFTQKIVLALALLAGATATEYTTDAVAQKYQWCVNMKMA